MADKKVNTIKLKYIGSNCSYTIGKLILLKGDDRIIEVDTLLAKNLISSGKFVDVEDKSV